MPVAVAQVCKIDTLKELLHCTHVMKDILRYIILHQLGEERKQNGGEQLHWNI